MSKRPRTAADSPLIQESIRRSIKGCTVKGCKFCAELQHTLDEAAKSDDLHWEDKA